MAQPNRKSSIRNRKWPKAPDFRPLEEILVYAEPVVTKGGVPEIIEVGFLKQDETTEDTEGRGMVDG